MTLERQIELHPSELSRSSDRVSIALRIGRNIGLTVTGNVAIAIFGVISLALNARALGATGLGVLALIMTIATLLDRIFAFQTWQPLVKLGTDALAAGDRARVGRLTAVAFLFDAMASSAAAVTAMLVVMLAGERLGLPPQYLGVAAIYMATLFTRVTDAPAGLLRLLDRFGLLTTVRAGEAAGQCLAAAILFVLGAPLTAYVLTFAGVAVATNIALLVCAFVVAARARISLTVRGLGAAWAGAWREFWMFSWAMGLSGTVGELRERVPVLLLGALLGPTAVGIYYVAERIAGVLGSVMWPVHQALYPEAARFAMRGRRSDLHWFVLRIGWICGGLGLVIFVCSLAFGDLALGVVGGLGYTEAYWPLQLLIGAYGVALAGVGLRSAVMITAGPKKLLKAYLLPFIPFLLVLPAAIVHQGVAGAAGAHVLFYLLWIVFMVREYTHSIRSADKVKDRQ